MPNMQNKIVFITGASAGIGAACAHMFAKHGAKLILTARRIAKLEKLAAELKQQHNAEVYSLQLDIRNLASVEQEIAGLPQEWQNIDVLINNAGLSAGFDAIQNGDIADWEQMIDTNVKGLLYVTRQILPGMVERNSGHVVNIGSIVSHETYPKAVVYSATKHAEKALSRGMLMDLCGTKVRVTSVDPGLVYTEFGSVRFKGDDEKVANFYKGTNPLTAHDIADTVFYCATRPENVNIAEVIMFPKNQASTAVIHREN